MKKYIAMLLAVALLLSVRPVAAAAQEAEQEIQLSWDGAYHTATLDGKAVPEYDYTWHADPTEYHADVKNSPAEYYTGSAPSSKAAVYIAHDIIYSPQLPQEQFQLINYSGDQEWVSTYRIPGYEDYIFTTLPALGSEFPAHMMHSPQEAYQNAVLHITQPGTYRIKGRWRGQIWVDVGKKEEDKVTLILDGLDISCTVAPAVVFYKVYESDSPQGEAGANILLAQGSENSIFGTNVYRILKAQYKDREGFGQEQKKAWKMDGAIHAYQTLHIGGEGILKLQSGFEGIASELHLTISGGDIRIQSRNDGINVSEDHVSALTVLGGKLNIQAGLGEEGDGMDSNGTIAIYGGEILTAGNPQTDVGLDSENGTYIHGGSVLSMGEIMTSANSGQLRETSQPVLKLEFAHGEHTAQDIVLQGPQGEAFAYRRNSDLPAGRTFPQMILSAPGLKLGQSYRLLMGQQRYAIAGSCADGGELTVTKQIPSFDSLAPVTHQYGPDGACGLCGESDNGAQATQPPHTTPEEAPFTFPETVPHAQPPRKKASNGDAALVIVTVGACVAVLALCLGIKKRQQ